MLAALRRHNFRLYFAAQIVSNIGTWVQITVENWLVLQLSHSGLALGVTNALQFGPSLVFGLYGGVIADARDKLVGASGRGGKGFQARGKDGEDAGMLARNWREKG